MWWKIGLHKRQDVLNALYLKVRGSKLQVKSNNTMDGGEGTLL